MSWRDPFAARAALIALAGFALGCATGHPLMPTPNLYSGADGYPEAAVPPASKSSQVDLLYATDRAPLPDDGGGLHYGRNRSASVGFGSAVVEIGEGETWEELVEASQGNRRKGKLGLELRSSTELGRFPPTPHPFTVVNDEPVDDPEVAAEDSRVAEALRSEIRRRLAQTEQKDVILYVHGFNNSFEFAACSQAEVWHFLGRRGVPILYSWPAAHGGLFGYFIDRESGEFTIYHLKQLIRLLVSTPEIERIHILAHSRGTDVATSALRELVIETRAAGKNPREHLRIANLVLAAADLDFDVVRQRLMAEQFGPAFGQITIYTTQADKALGVSQTLMSGTRFGRIKSGDLGESEQEIFTEVTNVNIINVQGVSGFIGHGYFRTSPAASSDLILILRDGSKPGDPNRPLTHQMLNFWEMPKDYPGAAESP
jgi:esterase/lipase superfamily enzyme